MVKLNKQLRRWIRDAQKAVEDGTWIITQHEKGNEEHHYIVGVVKDWVYASGEKDYIHIIAKIKGNPNRRHGWRSGEWVYKLFYMTTEAKKRKGVLRHLFVNFSIHMCAVSLT